MENVKFLLSPCIFGYTSWLDISLFRGLFNVKETNFRHHYVMFFLTPMIAVSTFLGFHWEKSISPMKCGLLTQKMTLVPSLCPLGDRRITSVRLCAVFRGPPLPTLRLACSTIISLPVPPSSPHRLLSCTRHFYWHMMFDSPANNYPAHFNLKVSQLSILYLCLHFWAASAVLNTLKSNFGTCSFPEASSFILKDL